MNICEGLEKINKKLGLNNFKLTVRFSQDGGKRAPRWDSKFIEKEMEQYAGNIEKIWVCGSPAMNEAFDKAFEELRFKLKLQPH